MSFRVIKEHLPWFAPSAAIVLAATGVIDFSPKTTTEAAAPVTSNAIVTEVSRNATQNPVAVGQQSTGIAPLASSATTALPAVVVQPQVQATPLVQPAVVAPQPVPVQPLAPQQVSIKPETQINPTTNPSAFFGAAQAKIAQDRSCIEDLRILAQDARVYFPSGGLTGEDTGLAQARLIGLVAQDCKNVEIIVKGHSDPSGDPNANLRLSQQRADAIVQRVGAAGIDVSRFRAVAMGSREPSSVSGTQSNAFYDRRVEFEVREIAQSAAFSPSSRSSSLLVSSCAVQLQAAVAQTKLFFAPRSITAPSDGLPAVVQLASAASACPNARLRVIGQYSDDEGSGETPATARLRAVALMSSLVASGFDPEQIIIAAHSKPTELAGQPSLSERRIDFDVILEN